MVTSLGAGLLALLVLAQDTPSKTPTGPDSTRAVRDAMSKNQFPWYDNKADTARPITPPSLQDSSRRESESTSTPRETAAPPSPLLQLSNTITMIGFGIGLAFLVGLLAWFWKIYEPGEPDMIPSAKSRAAPERVESLPEGMEREFESSDPWEESIRRRNRGDLAGAILCLFAHQLLTLSKLGLVRLAPGRTGRQLLRAVSDSELRALVQPTLRMFEAVYYGQRKPTEDEFAVVWAVAESFERRVASGVAR